MSLAESPSPSSSSGSDDFAALLDAELEHASAADSASLSLGDEEEEDDEVVVEVEALERGYVPPSVLLLIPSHWLWQFRAMCSEACALDARLVGWFGVGFGMHRFARIGAFY
jgi:hypothetical protein